MSLPRKLRLPLLFLAASGCGLYAASGNMTGYQPFALRLRIEGIHPFLTMLDPLQMAGIVTILSLVVFLFQSARTLVLGRLTLVLLISFNLWYLWEYLRQFPGTIHSEVLFHLTFALIEAWTLRRTLRPEVWAWYRRSAQPDAATEEEPGPA